MSEPRTLYKRKITEETPVGYIQEDAATCPSCGGKLERKGDEYKCPFCKKTIRHDLVLFDDSKDGNKSMKSQEEDKSKYEPCEYCGRKSEIIARCQECMGRSNSFAAEVSAKLFGSIKDKRTKLCEDCAKKCNNCGKYFCPKHINKHKCL